MINYRCIAKGCGFEFSVNETERMCGRAREYVEASIRARNQKQNLSCPVCHWNAAVVRPEKGKKNASANKELK